jgi:hypothetical protein
VSARLASALLFLGACVACGGRVNGTAPSDTTPPDSGQASSPGAASDGGPAITEDASAPTSGADSGEAADTAPPARVDSGPPPPGENSVPMIVNGGPGNFGSVDVPFISVTLCVPGTSNCQTIDYVTVDTGSTGFRVMSSVLNAGLKLPQENLGSDPLAECYTYASGYVWGSVRMADVKIGGEFAGSVPVHVIADPAVPSVPSDCASTGVSVNTVEDFGSNAIIGVNQLTIDCGQYCASQAIPTTYYTCPGGTCAATAVPLTQQVPDPASLFTRDNNGVVLDLPSVPAAGAATLSGTLTFGVGTTSNNALGTAKVLTVDDFGNFPTTFNGTTMSTSFIDSGSNTYAFNDSTIPQCTDIMGFYCPTSPMSLMAQNAGLNGVSTSISFSVANADTLVTTSGNYSAFDNLATTGLDNNTFDWGLPFFMGRTVFVGFAGGGAMPNGFFAY